MSRLAVVATLALTVSPLLASSLNGRVTRAWSTDGIIDVAVAVSIPSGKSFPTVKTDAYGNYTINELPQGQRVKIKYTRDNYQESPTYHYVTLVEGTNQDTVKMAPDDASESQYREYGAKLFQAEAIGSVDDDMLAMFAHLPPEKRALVADAYAALAAHGEPAQQLARANVLVTFDVAAQSRRQRQMEESLNAIAAQLSNIALTKREKRSVVVTIPTDFKPGQTDVPGSAKAYYVLLATYLKANPDLKITVEGHADPTGPRSLNDEVSAKRADSVRRWLVKGGVPANKVNALGVGESERSSDTTGDTTAERRVDVILTPTTGVS
jgi:outer membrane protein OmpA-like peptidoglycan-associated protein